jgi:hypothetical protein
MTATDDGIQSTIQDLNFYIKIKRNNITQETTGREIKRMMRQFTGKKIHDIHFGIPRYLNRKFHDRLSFEQLILENGETFIMTLRKAGSDDYEALDDVTGNYDTINAALYR